jgi:hypothetical protein
MVEQTLSMIIVFEIRAFACVLDDLKAFQLNSANPVSPQAMKD